MTGTENKNYLGMSDDDFLNATPPESKTEETSAAAADQGQQETAGSTAVVETEDKTPVSVVDLLPDEKPADEDKKDDKDAGKAATADDSAKPNGDTPPGSSGADDAAAKPGQAAEKTAETKEADKAVEADKTAEPKPGETAEAKADVKAEEKPVDYQAFFKQVMTPFKANGRTIELKTPDEAIRLMQMGAGYGRKIQDLQPALKTLKMLEKADLLDEGKLSFLIDINNKNPDAIKKLIKESGIDPLDLNIGDNVSYTPTSHSVSDKEMAFHSAVDDVQSNPSGQETLRIVNQTWDSESKAVLYDSPELLSVIQSQRENGVYAQIAAEIDRQKTIGKIAPTTPFLQAYKLAGDHLTATNGFRVLETKKEPEVQPTVITTRAEAPKAQVQNGDKAAAAAATKTASQRKAGAKVNPLSMADDDFLKTFEGRL